MPVTSVCCYAGRRNATSAFVRLSAAVSADRTQVNRRIYFVLCFSSGFCSGLTNIKYRHSSKPFNVVRHPICNSSLFGRHIKLQQPTHILAHLQGTQSRDTEANLAKELKFPTYNSPCNIATDIHLFLTNCTEYLCT